MVPSIHLPQTQRDRHVNINGDDESLCVNIACQLYGYLVDLFEYVKTVFRKGDTLTVNLLLIDAPSRKCPVPKRNETPDSWKPNATTLDERFRCCCTYRVTDTSTAETNGNTRGQNCEERRTDEGNCSPADSRTSANRCARRRESGHAIWDATKKLSFIIKGTLRLIENFVHHNEDARRTRDGNNDTCCGACNTGGRPVVDTDPVRAKPRHTPPKNKRTGGERSVICPRRETNRADETAATVDNSCGRTADERIVVGGTRNVCRERDCCSSVAKRLEDKPENYSGDKKPIIHETRKNEPRKNVAATGKNSCFDKSVNTSKNNKRP